MTDKRKRDILIGILDLVEEYESYDLDISFPEDGYHVYITVEVLDGE
jgi:hypothetical protein